jgi:hypothetical protein
VGWRDATAYLSDHATITNIGQPKTMQQRDMVCTLITAMIGTPYDWDAIAADAGMAFGLGDIWQRKADGMVPGAVVCSSLAAYAYDKAQLTAPMGDYRTVTPGDWAELIVNRGWQKPLELPHPPVDLT